MFSFALLLIPGIRDIYYTLSDLSLRLYSLLRSLRSHLENELRNGVAYLSTNESRQALMAVIPMLGIFSGEIHRLLEYIHELLRPASFAHPIDMGELLNRFFDLVDMGYLNEFTNPR